MAKRDEIMIEYLKHEREGYSDDNGMAVKLLLAGLAILTPLIIAIVIYGGTKRNLYFLIAEFIVIIFSILIIMGAIKTTKQIRKIDSKIDSIYKKILKEEK